MSKKLYVSYPTIHKLVKSLAEQVIASGYDPDIIVAIGSGGFIPARILKTFINRPIFAVGISYYNLEQKHTLHPQKIQWIDETQQQLRGKKILLIDEVDDTRSTLSYCIEELMTHKPTDIATVVLHNKLKPKDALFPPSMNRYFAGIETEDVWILYPWDAHDIDEHTRQEAVQQTNEGVER
ncbi:MAG: phosphoribosyltransferase [Sphaerochaetaceae bacterium]|jgi:hypoxanthine phosphoribosyltransferase